MKESIIYYRSFYEALIKMPTEIQMEVNFAIFKYSFEGDTPKMSNIAEAFFILIKPQLDANERRYENGKQGGAPKGNKNALKKDDLTQNTTITPEKDQNATITTEDNQNTTKTTENNQNNQKQPTVVLFSEEKQPNVNVNCNVNDNYNYKEKDNEAEVEYGTVAPEYGDMGLKDVSELCISYSKDDSKLKDALLSFVLMRRSMNKTPTVSEMGFILRNLDKISRSRDDKLEIISRSIRNRWKDLYPGNDKKLRKGKGAVFREMEKHEYSEDEYKAMFTAEFDV